MKPNTTCEHCNQPSKETELLCNFLRCKAWVHHACYEEIVIENQLDSLYFCKLHAKRDEEKLPIVDLEEFYELEDLNKEEATNNLNQSIVKPPKTDMDNKNLNNDQVLFGENSNYSMCIRCKKNLSEIFARCYGCDKKFHLQCIDTLETRRVTNLEFECTSCFDISQRIIQRLNLQSKEDNYMSKPPKPFSPKVNTRQSNNNFPSINQNHDRTGNYNCSKFMPTLNSPNFNRSVEHAYGSFMEKYHARELPEVTDDDYTWSIFYETFKSTCHLFNDFENIVRIKNAIKSKEILRKGGPALVNAFTYKEAIESINSRIGRNLNFIHKEARKLISTPKIKPDNFNKIIEFIDDVRSFVQLAEAYQDNSYLNNKMFINSILECVPSFISNKWVDKQCDLEARGIFVSLRHLMSVLEAELTKVECKLRNSQLSMSDRDPKPKTDRPKSYNTDGNPKNDKVKFDSKYCWLHRNTEHPSHKCKALWSMDGKIVSDLAKQNHRCTTCGQNFHDTCPIKEKLMCKIEDCNIRHHALYCYKRKGGWKPKKDDKNNSHMDKSDETDEYSIDNDCSEENFCHALNSIDSDSDSEREDPSQFYTATNYSSFVDCNFANNGHSFNVHNTKISLNNNQKKKIEVKDDESDKSIMGVLVLKLDEKVDASFLIDSGSNVSLIEEKLANFLKSKGPLLPLMLGWSGDHMRKDKNSRIIKVKATNLSQPNISHELYFRTMFNLNMSDQNFVAHEFYRKFNHLRELKLFDYQKISGLIGIDNLFVFERDKVYRSTENLVNQPIGVRSPLGDYVMYTKYSLEDLFYQLQGHKPIKDEGKVCNSHAYELTEEELKEIDSMEKEVLGLEYFLPRENDRQSFDDELAFKIMKRDIKRIENSLQFEAPLLWREENIKLPTEESYKIALKRFLIVEKHAKKLNRFEECEEQMRNLIIKGYAKELTGAEADVTTNKTYYNPIFYIFPKGKRFRMIWDLASKTDGKSINDFLISGPNLYNSLLKITFQMRENLYLFKADMEEMFHQIKIKEEDTEALRFLFRFQNESKIRVFKMLVLPFGASCSPAISQFVKNIISEECKLSNFTASEIISHSTYVDDIVTSFKTFEDALNLPIEIKNILKTGGFNLLKFNSNDKSLKNNWKHLMAEEDLTHKKLFSEDEEEKILGYKVNFSEDSISLALSFGKVPSEILSGKCVPSKRQFLQLLMSIYDPIGFFQFIVSKLKLIYHRVCLEKTDWEEQIDENNLKEFLRLLPYIQKLESIKIPRNYIKAAYTKVQLFGFGDAGVEILCGIIYFRFLNEHNEQVGISLIYAKSFIVPAKQNRTIPELELYIASLISKMVNEVKLKHTIQFDESFLFTDNAAVYEWIKRDPKKPSIYVKNKMNVISSLTSKADWNWIPTDFMPADFGTKSCSMPEFTYDNYWFFPKLFRLPESSWPSFKPNFVEENNVNTHTDVLYDILDAKNYNHYLSMVYVVQFCYKLKLSRQITKIKKEINKTEALKSKENHNRDLRMKLKNMIDDCEQKSQQLKQSNFMFDHIEKIILKKVQEESFTNEIDMLKKGISFPKSNKFSHLLLWLDEDGLIRAKSRITFNQENKKIFGYDRMFPILLPKNHRLTELLIIKEHKNKKHIFRNSIIVAIRSRFYIPNIFSVVKKVTKDCQFCMRYNAVPLTPLMGDMPSIRLKSHVPPFTYAMVDISGPYTLKVSRKISAKRYIFVCTCLNTRAIHMEVIESLDANATLIALQNTINLRGSPQKLYSDHGTNFHGAHTILLENVQNWNIKLLEKGLIRKPIEWVFGPARSPHSQGAVERLIGLVKRVMNKIFVITHERHENLSDFSFRAIVTEVIGMLNNRPLCLSTTNNNDILTPNHFLMMRTNFQEVPKSNLENIPLNDNWFAVQQLSNKLWSFWTNEYLPKILYREKWINHVEPLKEGDIVITFDPTVSNSWRLGKIIKVEKGSQNQTRKVEILLGKKSIIEKIDVLNRQKLKNIYLKEKHAIVTRHVSSVAKINLSGKF